MPNKGPLLSCLLKENIMKQIRFDLSDLHRFALGFDPMFDSLHRVAGATSTNYPPYNIVKIKDPAWDESVTQYRIDLAVAGFHDDEINIEVLKNELIIHGEQKPVELPEGTEYLHQGIAARSFVRTFTLAENVEVKGAESKNGILSVTLEHKIPEAALPKRIVISSQK